MLIAILLCHVEFIIMLTVIILSFYMLNVVMLSVVASFQQLRPGAYLCALIGATLM
jgi:hypothetical protein